MSVPASQSLKNYSLLSKQVAGVVSWKRVKLSKSHDRIKNTCLYNKYHNMGENINTSLYIIRDKYPEYKKNS